MITKTDAAERQLNTAIRLFFENRDHLSSYALAVASREVTDGVIESRYSELYQRELVRVGDPLEVRLSYRKEIEIRIKDEFYAKFLNLDRKWQNFLKHAKTDPDAEMEPFTTKELGLVILTAIWNHTLLTQHSTAEIAAFLSWMEVAEPQLVRSAPEYATIKEIAEMRSSISSISVNPYDRNTLETIYSAMTNV